MKNKRENQNNSHLKKGSRRVAPLATLQPFFGQLLESYHQPHWLKSDPIQFVHRYKSPDDQEVVGFITACFAYGSVKLVHRAVEIILKPMGAHPAKFVRGFNGSNYWPGFYHRFHTDEHLVILITLLKQALDEHGSLSELFRAQRTVSDEHPCEQVLNGVARWFQTRANKEIRKNKRLDLSRGLLFFFNAPEDGSACKRMVMYLRWMTRKDEIDLGLWKWFDPADLVVPADTHVSRIAYYLRLRGGKEERSANWAMAREITESLKVIDRDDPVKYDFALARLGILDICKKQYTKSVCERCPVEPGCRYSNLISNGGA